MAARQTARTSHRAQLGLAPSDSLETSIPNAASRSRSSTALWPWVGHGRTPLAGSLLQASPSVLSLVRPSAFHGLRSRKGSRSNFTSQPVRLRPVRGKLREKEHAPPSPHSCSPSAPGTCSPLSPILPCREQYALLHGLVWGPYRRSRGRYLDSRTLAPAPSPSSRPPPPIASASSSPTFFTILVSCARCPRCAKETPSVLRPRLTSERARGCRARSGHTQTRGPAPGDLWRLSTSWYY